MAGFSGDGVGDCHSECHSVEVGCGYNPDWAVLVEQDGGERLYFVVETKSSAFLDDLRDKERAKVKCGEAHFGALRLGEAPGTYIRAHSVDEVLTYRLPK